MCRLGVKACILTCLMITLLVTCFISCGIVNNNCFQEMYQSSDNMYNSTDSITSMEESSIFDDSSGISGSDISHIASAKNISEFTYRITYTDALLPGGVYPYGNIIRSENDLLSYISEINNYSLFNLEKQFGEFKSFNNVCAEYNIDFFKTHALLLLVVQGIADNPPTIDEINIVKDTINIEINGMDESISQVYHIIVEVASELIDSANEIDVFASAQKNDNIFSE